MKELVDSVAEKAGISEEKANTAVQTVLGFLKDKLPAPIASQLDKFAGGEGAEIPGEGVASGIGDVLTRKAG